MCLEMQGRSAVDHCDAYEVGDSVFKNSAFPPQRKDKQVRLIGDTKFQVDVNERGTPKVLRE